MLDGLFKFLSEQDFLSSDWLIFYAGLAAVALPWLLNTLYQKITYKPRMFEGDIYDLQFPVSDNGAVLGRETELDSLTQAWRSPEIRVLALVAWAGVGKTALVNVWREAIKFSEDETLSPNGFMRGHFRIKGLRMRKLRQELSLIMRCGGSNLTAKNSVRNTIKEFISPN
jgi:hypothetical protein